MTTTLYCSGLYFSYAAASNASWTA